MLDNMHKQVLFISPPLNIDICSTDWLLGLTMTMNNYSKLQVRRTFRIDSTNA